MSSLETAVESSKDALDATRLGYELDSRNLVDLLQAERNYSDTQNRLAQAKYGFIVTSLQFKQAVGLLKPSGYRRAQLKLLKVPELPEVETTKRGIEPHLVGKKFIGSTLRRLKLRIKFNKKELKQILNKK